MENSLQFILLICVLLFHIVISSVEDCWDDTKLSRMKFSKKPGEDDDVGLAKFSRMMRCLAQEQGGAPQQGDWGKFDGNRPGQFVPNWNNQRNSAPPKWNGAYDKTYDTGSDRRRDRDRDRDLERERERERDRDRDDTWRPKKQPQPGIHPDDWTRGGTNDPSWTRRGQPADPPPGWGGADNNQRRPLDAGDTRNRDYMYGGGANSPDPSSVNNWNLERNPNLASNDRDYVFMNNEDSATLSLSRKYGYAIMALSVVVLAVLMVATIFCCNSSNSTMSQAATHAVPVGQYDAYSIYSFKGGMDTMRSSGTLGGATLHTDTMKSSRSMASPQYRISDIDPDFARRFEKDNHQY